MKREVEDLTIYQKYIELIYYTEMITEKYPRYTRMGIVNEIKNATYDGMKEILVAYRIYEKGSKLEALNKLDINMKMLKVMIRISYRKKYINIKNYEAWSRKLNDIGSLLGGWINSCVRL